MPKKGFYDRRLPQRMLDRQETIVLPATKAERKARSDAALERLRKMAGVSSGPVHEQAQHHTGEGQTGPKGGVYHLSDSGQKVYEKK